MRKFSRFRSGAGEVVLDNRAPTLAVRGVSKTYLTKGSDVPAVTDIDLEVVRGSITAIVGPSGCGKSTLLRMLAGVLPADNGDIFLAGARVTGPSQRIGMMFQHSALLQWRDVLRNVLLPVDILKLPRSNFEEQARNLLAQVGLAGSEKLRPHELSGGMQQRVAICRALIHDPAVLLLDEPFGALDSITREQLNDLLLAICKTGEKTAVLVTHDIEESVYLADQVIVMSSRPGRIVERVRVDLPYPRDWTARSLPEFERTTQRVRKALADYIGLAGPRFDETEPGDTG
ncbi:MAG: ATP-binding cassette domain-containing protein [Actinophytocola sp.]|nr:ATP-binding cassette domain-containing protein [Actinophytocola sp.]